MKSCLVKDGIPISICIHLFTITVILTLLLGAYVLASQLDNASLIKTSSKIANIILRVQWKDSIFCQTLRLLTLCEQLFQYRHCTSNDRTLHAVNLPATLLESTKRPYLGMTRYFPVWCVAYSVMCYLLWWSRQIRSHATQNQLSQKRVHATADSQPAGRRGTAFVNNFAFLLALQSNTEIT